MRDICILGAGSWGTALAILLSKNGHQVTVWSIDPEEVLMLRNYREQRDKLPGVIVPSTVDFTTDSSMFHVNETKDGKAELTVKDGQMTVHIVLTSKNIVNLYPGLAEDAQKDDAVLLQPTVESVTYSDGTTEDVNAFDVPVPVLDEEFDLALIGTKQKWYDHKVTVSNPVKAE